MFVLRRITSQNVERNTVLGESYILIDAKKNIEDYQKSLNVLKVSEDKDIYGFISYDEGTKLIPLYKKSTYFVMTGNGNTFANISFK